MQLLWIAMFSLLALSCTVPPEGHLVLSSGESASSLISSADSAVVLIYDPADCLSCYSVLSKWHQLKRSSPERVALVLTRQPTEAERRELVAARIEADGILASQEQVEGLRTPIEILYVDGLRTARFEGVQGRSLLLEEFAR